MIRSLLIAMFLCLAASVEAQDPYELGDEWEHMNLPPREVEQLLADSIDAADNERFSEAVKSLGLILGIDEESATLEGEGQDFFLPVGSDELSEAIKAKVQLPPAEEPQVVEPDSLQEIDPDTGLPSEEFDVDSGPYVLSSVHEIARLLLDGLPPEGQKTIELLYGIDSQRRLDEAVAANDWQTIQNLSGRFSMTAAGRLAVMIDAEHQAAVGNGGLAARLLLGLTDLKMGREQFGALPGVLAAAIYKSIDNPAASLRAIERTRALAGGADASLGDIRISLRSSPERIFEQLPDVEAIFSGKTATQSYPGGSPDRNSDSYAQEPTPFVRWHAIMHDSETAENKTLATIKQVAASDDNYALVPSRIGVIAPPYLIVRTYDEGLRAIDLATGRIAWSPVLAPDATLYTADRNDGESEYRLPVKDALAERIWGHRSSGSIAADERHVYAIATRAGVDNALSIFRGAFADVQRPVPSSEENVLQAYDHRQSGKLAWEVGGLDGLAEPQLAGAFFLGPPLPLADELLVLVELRGEVNLAGLNPKTGHLHWRQQLVSNPYKNMGWPDMSENLSATPSLADGMIVAPTLSGYLVGVDARSHDLVWASPYGRDTGLSEYPRVNVMGGYTRDSYHPLESRSIDEAALISQGVAVYAAGDGDGVQAHNIDDGKMLWEVDQTQRNRRIISVVAIIDNLVVVLSRDGLEALSLREGQPLWTLDLGEFGKVVGRPVRNDKSLFVPTTAGKLIEVDCVEGTIKGETSLELPLGNLIATNDDLISVGAVNVSCYRMGGTLRDQLAALGEGQDDSSKYLLLSAQLAAAQDDWPNAFEAALSAYRGAPGDPQVGFMVRKIALAALDRDFERFATRIDELAPLLSSGPQRASYLIGMARGRRSRGDLSGALQTMVDLVDYELNEGNESEIDQVPLTLDLSRQIARKQWVATELPALLDEASPEERSTAVERLRKLAADAISRNKLPVASGLLRHIPDLADVHLLAAFESLSAGELSAAEASAWAAMRSTADSKEWAKKLGGRTLLMVYRQAVRPASAVATASELGIPIEEIDAIGADDLFTAWQDHTVIDEQAEREVALIRSKLSTVEFGKLTAAEEAAGDSAASSTAVYSLAALRRLGGGDDRAIEAARIENMQPSEAIGPFTVATATPMHTVGTALERWQLTVGAEEMTAYNPAGRPVVTAALENRNSPHPVRFYAIDSLLVMQRGGELTTVDTLEKPSADPATFDRSRGGFGSLTARWHKHFGHDRPQAHRGFGSTPRWDWGAEIVRDYNDAGITIAGRHGVIVAADSKIQLLEISSGEVLWSVDTTKLWNRPLMHSNYRGRTVAKPWLTATDEMVILLDPVADARVVLRADSGEVVGVHPLDAQGDVWAAEGGRYLVTSRMNNGPFRFEMRDGVTGDLVQELTSDPSSRAAFSPGDGAVFWGPKQPLVYWNMLTGQASAHEMTAPESFEAFSVQPQGESLLLVGHVPGMHVDIVENTNHDSLKMAGLLLAIDRTDGRPRWQQSLAVYGYNLPLRVPQASPVILLTRSLQVRYQRDLVRRCSLAAIDLATGRVLLEDNYLPAAQGSIFAATYRPDESAIELTYAGNAIRLAWQRTEQALSANVADPNETEVDARSDGVGRTNAGQWIDNMPQKLQEELQRTIDSAPISPFFE